MSVERLHVVAFVWLVLLVILGLPLSIWLGLSGSGWELLVVTAVAIPVTVGCCIILGGLAERGLHP